LYFAALAESYRSGDMGQVYPIARGAAPLMTATASPVFIGETLGASGWAGVIALTVGVIMLSARGGRDLAVFDRRTVAFAFMTAITICAYSIVDGIGARLSHNAIAYSVWLFFGNALVLIPYAVARTGTNTMMAARKFCSRGSLAAPCNFSPTVSRYGR
jgi:drug/metabolite transporter (DMT)-like permease